MWYTTRRGISAFCFCLLVLSILVAIASSQRGKFVNCKKMVFAPICRGVAAKRSGSIHYKAQSQFPYSLRGPNQFMLTEKQSPYWIYHTRLNERTNNP